MLLRRVVCPEDIQERFIGNPRRVVFDPDGFAMISQRPVSGVLSGAPRITNLRADDTFDEPEPGVSAPESRHGKSCDLRFDRQNEVYRRDGASRPRLT